MDCKGNHNVVSSKQKTENSVFFMKSSYNAHLSPEYTTDAMRSKPTSHIHKRRSIKFYSKLLFQLKKNL